MDAGERKRARGMEGATNTSGDAPAIEGKRCRVGHLHLASVADKEVVEARAQRLDSGMKAYRGAAEASPMGGVDAAISSWAADQCNEALGRDLTADEEKTHVASAKAAR